VGKTVRLLCQDCGEAKSIVYKTKFTLKAHMKNHHDKVLEFFDENQEVLVYDKREYEAESTSAYEKNADKKKLNEKINTGEIKSHPLKSIGKDVRVLCPDCPLKPDSVIFKSKTTLKIHMLHHHTKVIDIKDEGMEVPVLDEEEYVREFEVAKQRVADAEERVKRLTEIMAKLEEDPMLLVPEEMDYDAEEEKSVKDLNGELTQGEESGGKGDNEDDEDDQKEGDETVKKTKQRKPYNGQMLLIPFDLVHGNTVRVFCAICRKEFINRYLLKAHFKQHHVEWHEEVEAKPSTGILVVDIDEYKRAAQKEIDSGAHAVHFRPKQLAKIEISKKLGLSPPPPPKAFNCKLCGKRFSHHRARTRHVKRAHPLAVQYGADAEDFRLPLGAGLEQLGVRPPRHPERINMKQPAATRTCRICNQEFADRIYYRKHMKTKHKITNIGSYSGLPGRPPLQRPTLSLPPIPPPPSNAALGSVKSLADHTDDDDDDDIIEDVAVDEPEDPYEDSQIECEEAEERNKDHKVDLDGPPHDPGKTIPLIAVPYLDIPSSLRVFCHFDDCRWRLSSRGALLTHLACVHTYIVDESTYQCLVEDDEMVHAMLKNYQEGKKNEEERTKWNKFLQNHTSYVTPQEVCTYLVHNKILEPDAPILSKYPMVPFRFIQSDQTACPLCETQVKIKWTLHKHMQLTHSIEIDIDDIKPKKERKNQETPKRGPSSVALAAEIKKKARRDALTAYKMNKLQKQLEKQASKQGAMNGRSVDVNDDYSVSSTGSYDASTDAVYDEANGVNGGYEYDDYLDSSLAAGDDDYVVINDDDEDYSSPSNTLVSYSSSGRRIGPGSRGPYKKKNKMAFTPPTVSSKKSQIPVPEDLTAVPFEDVRPYNLRVVCHVCYRVICNKTYLRQHLAQRHSADVSNFEKTPILLYKTDAKNLAINIFNQEVV